MIHTDTDTSPSSLLPSFLPLFLPFPFPKSSMPPCASLCLVAALPRYITLRHPAPSVRIINFTKKNKTTPNCSKWSVTWNKSIKIFPYYEDASNLLGPHDIRIMWKSHDIRIASYIMWFSHALYHVKIKLYKNHDLYHLMACIGKPPPVYPLMWHSGTTRYKNHALHHVTIWFMV